MLLGDYYETRDRQQPMRREHEEAAPMDGALTTVAQEVAQRHLLGLLLLGSCISQGVSNHEGMKLFVGGFLVRLLTHDCGFGAPRNDASIDARSRKQEGSRQEAGSPQQGRGDEMKCFWRRG
jgi:hypothetical protein